MTAGTALAAGAAETLAVGAAGASTTAEAEGTASTTADAEADATSPGFTSEALQPINAAAQQTIITVFFMFLSPNAVMAVLIIS